MLRPLNRTGDAFTRRTPRRPQNVAKKVRGYICPRCDIVLDDGVSYDWCPACSARIDWFDVRKPVWACPECAGMINAHRRVPWCAACDRDLVQVYTPKDRPRSEVRHARKRNQPKQRSRRRPPKAKHPRSMLARMRRFSFSAKPIASVFILSLLPLLLLSLDDGLRWSMIGIAGPWILLPVLVGGLLLSTVGASWKELIALIGNRKTRVVHGLEHATLKLLEARGAPVASGLTHDISFFAHFKKNGSWHNRESAIRAAVKDAIAAIQAGDRDLAFDRRCGTSYLIAFLLLGLLAVAACVVAFFVSLSLGGVMLTFFAFACVMALGARPLGLAAQRWLTVSTEFRSARLVRLTRLRPRDGVARYSVELAVEIK